MAERKRQNARERKPAILKAFYQVIESDGFENASIGKVAKRAGVHPSLVIHYFGTKETMVVELVDDVLKTYSDLFRQLPRDGEPGERLDRLLDLIWSRQWHDAVGLSSVFSFLALSQRAPEVMERVKNLYRQYRRYLVTQLEFLQQAGIVRIDSSDAAVEALISLSEGSHYFCRFHVPPERLDEHCRNMTLTAKRILQVTTPPSRGLK
jgi:AcrR family transcriptional regulator